MNRRTFLKAGIGAIGLAATGAVPSLLRGAARPVIIGGTVALTGPFSAPGVWFERVWRWYWEQRINSQGGLLGRPVRLVLYDDQSTPSNVASLYQRLITVDKVDLLLGPYPTPSAAVVIPIAENTRRVLMNVGTAASTLLLRRGNRYIFTAYTELDVEYAKSWFEWMTSLGAKRPAGVALLTMKNPFTLGVRGGALNLAKKAGIPVVADETYDPETTNFAPLARRVQGAGAQALGLLSYFPDSVSITRACRDVNYNPSTIYNVISSNNPEWETDLGSLGNYAMSFTQCWHTLRYHENADLWAFLQSKYRLQRMPFHAGVAMNAAQCLRAAVVGARTIENQDAIAEYLRTHAIETVSGTVKFSAEGVPNYFGLLTQVQNGQPEIVWPPVYKTQAAVFPKPAWS